MVGNSNVDGGARRDTAKGSVPVKGSLEVPPTGYVGDDPRLPNERLACTVDGSPLFRASALVVTVIGLGNVLDHYSRVEIASGRWQEPFGPHQSLFCESYPESCWLEQLRSHH